MHSETSRSSLAMTWFSLVLLTLSACTVNPFRTAQTVEQQGDALYGAYVIAKEQGAALLQDTSVPDEAKRPIAAAMVASKDTADALQDALTHYSEVAAALKTGVTTQEQLAIAEQNVGDWLIRALPLIEQLIRSVGGGER